MKSIEVSTSVFAAIWARRQAGEETENEILMRIFGLATATPSVGHPEAQTGKVRWVDDVREALSQLGGQAAYADIYAKVRNIRAAAGRSIPISFKQVVRKEIETHSSSSEAYLEREDIFYAPHGLGAGIWALR